MATEAQHLSNAEDQKGVDQFSHKGDPFYDLFSPRYFQKVLAEAVGVFTLVFVGCGSVVVDAKTNGGIGQLGIAAGFGVPIMIMIYTLGHISGGHFNPSVTLGLAAVKRFPLIQVPGYILGQVAGGTIGAGLLKGLLGQYGGLGTTTPSGTFAQSFGMEIVMTFFLVFVISGTATDNRAQGPFAGIAIGATIFVDISFAGLITGGSMNPARSLGPAFVSGIYTGIWVYIIGPIIGGQIAVWLYEVLRDANES